MVAGCGPERLSSLPVQAPVGQVTATPGGTPVASSSGTAVTSPSGPAVARPGRPPAPPRRSPPVTTGTAEPTQGGSATPTCRGAVRHDVDLSSNEVGPDRWMCFHTGGVLRLQGIGPGLVKAEPPELVDVNYAAAVHDIAFLHPGTVTVTITRDERIDEITVVVRA
ncbi:hypothetical protein [Micromonospora sp. CPCC 206061]|uniref:hypothetical protein n=1 Tax=Micromonospora sp. CPCC 206061 TaxID=3122410 RepID=UPI002FF3E839